MKKTVILGMLICWLLIGCQTPDSLPTTGDYQFGLGRFDRAMIRLMEKWKIPGGALAVMQDGEILLARGYGYADMETEELVQPNSLFRIASISKPITAAAVLKLVEEGKLELDTPAFQILNEFHPPEGAEVDPRINEITIRHLLEHSGGWDRDSSFDPMFLARKIAKEMGTPSPADCPTIIRYMLKQPLNFDPGSNYAYSNFGYCVLGRVIENISGMTYEDYVKTQILEPIGIQEMRLGHSLLVDRAEGEVRYYGTELTFAPSVFPEIAVQTTWPYGGFYLEAMDSHGGWIASAPDLARLAFALDYKNPGVVLDSASLELMFARPEIHLWEEASNYYALGWQVRPTWKGKNIWHAGSLPGTSALLYRTSDGLIWAASFNSRIDAQEDEFFVDLITVMGQAAFYDEILWICSGLIIGLVGVCILLFVRALRKERKPGDESPSTI